MTLALGGLLREDVAQIRAAALDACRWRATLKRFLAPLLVFILGMTAPFSDIAPGASQREDLGTRTTTSGCDYFFGFGFGCCRRRDCGGRRFCCFFRCASFAGAAFPAASFTASFLAAGAAGLTATFLRRQHHHHLPAFHFRKLLDDAVLLRRSFFTRSMQPDAEFLVRHFASAEPQRHLALVALLRGTASGCAA